jgi:2,3-dihydroxyphenylpropionate 1,2-dioxygenase
MAPNYEFDRWVVQETAAGRYQDLLDLTPVNLDEVGESELLTWFVLLGIIGELPGHLLSYQELAHHGQGVVQFLPQAADDTVHEASREVSVPKYGGYEFTSEDFVYYKFPEPESLPLNRFLHRLIVEEQLRDDYARDADAVIAASGLDPRFQDALRRPGFDALVEAGAHPLLALSSRQVVRLAADRMGTAS